MPLYNSLHEPTHTNIHRSKFGVNHSSHADKTEVCATSHSCIYFTLNSFMESL